MRVAWICHFSNKEINQKLPLKVGGCYGFIYRLIKGRFATTEVSDFGVWNINAINEMKKYTDSVELHVIAPYPHLKTQLHEYSEDSIYYHFIRPGGMFIEKIFKHFPAIYNLYKPSYKKNRSIIKSLIDNIRPSIVHLVGAENPYYSLSSIDIPKDIKLIVQLQTLMSDPKFFANYPIGKETYDYRVGVEKKVIKRADYVGTGISDFRKIILEDINSDARFLDLKLAVGESIRKIEIGKKYDFVYFARYINKACDWAIASFVEASKRKSDISLLVIGAYTPGEKSVYDKLLEEQGLLDNVTFTGELPTHEDVLENVATARVALLPIKIDFIPGTIREASALGLPIVTSITDGTPLLNEKRNCVLLSEGGDHVSMAENMINLLDNPDLADELVQNSYLRLQEEYNNAKVIYKWVEAYKHIQNS